jgi:two-component system response regulator HydG
MQQVYAIVEQVGPTDATVLVTGQSGTGKEMVARALHQQSARRDRPFVAVDCAAIPDALIESELFGHARGAFTDAKTARSGLLPQADGGTIFLDEIADLPLAVQPKLLRVLQERRIRPIGSDTESGVDVRVVAATNRDLEAMVAAREFREDLYYRINVIHLALPPLRVRAGDVLMLAQHFLEHFARMFGRPTTALTPEAAERLARYPWPGNVRELKNAIERAVAMANGPHLTVEDLPEKVRGYRQPPERHEGELSVDLSLDELERLHILRVLEVKGGNKLAAAQALGIDRKTLYRKLQRYGVEGET